MVTDNTDPNGALNTPPATPFAPPPIDQPAAAPAPAQSTDLAGQLRGVLHEMANILGEHFGQEVAGFLHSKIDGGA